jgi:hypothetical protein
MMSNQEMLEVLRKAGWKATVVEPRDDAHYWLAFAYREEDDKLSGAKQVLSLDSSNMALRLLSNALGFPIPPEEYVPPLKTRLLSLRFAVEENIKVRSATR